MNTTWKEIRYSFPKSFRAFRNSHPLKNSSSSRHTHHWYMRHRQIPNLNQMILDTSTSTPWRASARSSPTWTPWSAASSTSPWCTSRSPSEPVKPASRRLREPVPPSSSWPSWTVWPAGTSSGRSCRGTSSCWPVTRSTSSTSAASRCWWTLGARRRSGSTPIGCSRPSRWPGGWTSWTSGWSGARWTSWSGARGASPLGEGDSSRIWMDGGGYEECGEVFLRRKVSCDCRVRFENVLSVEWWGSVLKEWLSAVPWKLL